MNSEGKSVNEDVAKLVTEWKIREDAYNEMPKDKLITRLIMTEMELEGRDEETDKHSIELWYFVGDKTGTKYLSDEEPIRCYTCHASNAETVVDALKALKRVDIDDSVVTTETEMRFVMPELVFMTDGEINIRVPKKMESMFPEIKYGDDPIKVKVVNITL